MESKLDDSDRIKKLDGEGMLDDLEGFPEQCRQATQIGQSFSPPFDLRNFDRVFINGMGGSAIIGDLLNDLVDPEVITSRSYHLPPNTGKEDLMIAISNSGNTEETLSALEDGRRRGLRLLALSTGGKMEDYCKTYDLPRIDIPGGLQPRASTGYMLFPLLEMFTEAGLTGTFRPETTYEGLEELARKFRARTPLEDNPAKQLASTLQGKVPLIYGTQANTETVAYRWKTQFNENAKQPAFWNVFPELNHNETVGYTLQDELMANGYVILLKNGLETEDNKIRMEIMEEIFAEEGIDFQAVEAPEGSKILKILGQTYLGDFVSTYLAILNGFDPSPVELIEDFKKRMKERK